MLASYANYGNLKLKSIKGMLIMLLSFLVSLSFSYVASRYWLIEMAGWKQLGLGILIGVGAINAAIVVTVGAAGVAGKEGIVGGVVAGGIGGIVGGVVAGGIGGGVAGVAGVATVIAVAGVVTVIAVAERVERGVVGGVVGGIVGGLFLRSLFIRLYTVLRHLPKGIKTFSLNEAVKVIV